MWLVNLLESMIGDGESPFLKTVSRCLDSRHPDLVSICLITIAWLSSSLSMQCNAGLHLAAFLAVISQVKEVLENAELELKTLASMCLLNFSKISGLSLTPFPSLRYFCYLPISETIALIFSLIYNTAIIGT